MQICGLICGLWLSSVSIGVAPGRLCQSRPLVLSLVNMSKPNGITSTVDRSVRLHEVVTCHDLQLNVQDEF